MLAPLTSSRPCSPVGSSAPVSRSTILAATPPRAWGTGTVRLRLREERTGTRQGHRPAGPPGNIGPSDAASAGMWGWDRSAPAAPPVPPPEKPPPPPPAAVRSPPPYQRRN